MLARASCLPRPWLPLLGSLALLAATGAVAKAEELEAHFRRACEARERPELKRTPSWTWIAQVCAAEAAERGQRFMASDREQRLAMIEADCQDWHARNEWRFGKRILADRTRWDRVVEAKCRAEALEELPRLEARQQAGVGLGRILAEQRP